MRVVLAKNAGACYGVKRALDMALGALADSRCAYTLGPLIHNPAAVADLESRGVHVAERLEDVAEGVVIIRSHGVTPEVRDEVMARGLPVVDATCPHVARAQNAAAELARAGRRVIVVGEEGHPEVEGLCAYARREGVKVDVVPTADAVPADLGEPVGVVVQTTQRRENLDAVVARIEQQEVDLVVKSTICSATRLRQDAAADLAAQVDVMVILGGRNSSNTTRLYEICAGICPNAYHVESVDELRSEWFEGCQTVGVTAGASTPEAQIHALVVHLEAL